MAKKSSGDRVAIYTGVFGVVGGYLAISELFAMISSGTYSFFGIAVFIGGLWLLRPLVQSIRKSFGV